MRPDAAFFEKLSRFRLAMGHKSSMNLTGNRKSTQKGSSTEFSDFREYMPGDDIRRIDWNAYGRLDRYYIKEYMEEKEAVVNILLDTSASMDYGENKKSELAVMLVSAFAYLGWSNMDRVTVYDMKRMQTPYVGTGGKNAIQGLLLWLDKCSFEGQVDVNEAVRQMPAKGNGVTIIISDFLQEAFLEEGQEATKQLLRYLNYCKQKPVLLHVLAREELEISMTGTKNFIDAEDASTLRVTLEAPGIREYEQALKSFINTLQRESSRSGASYVLCDTGKDINELLFRDLRMLYDI